LKHTKETISRKGALSSREKEKWRGGKIVKKLHAFEEAANLEGGKSEKKEVKIFYLGKKQKGGLIWVEFAKKKGGSFRKKNSSPSLEEGKD